MEERLDGEHERREGPGTPDIQGDQDALEQSMGMGSVGDVRPGQIVNGTVVHISGDSVLVDVGAKSEGVIHLRDLSHRRLERPDDLVKMGDTFPVYVIGWEGDEGMLRLSKRRADEQNAWKTLEAALESREVLEAEVTEVVRGGLVVDVGLRGFVPSSHVAKGFINDLHPFLGQTLRLRVIELDRSKRRAILSRKNVVEEETRTQREQLWKEIEEGQVREGTVKSLTDFGAFVDLGGVDGLLHISEMSWGRIQHPSEVVTEGQKIAVKVLRLDREREKVSLGLRQVTPNPWDLVADRYPEGLVTDGKVVRLATFGAFVELEPGVDGLVHISQLAEHRIGTPAEVVQVGDAIRVKVLYVDPEAKRISLSKREADEEDARIAEEEAANPTEEPGGTTIGERMAAYHAGNWDDDDQ